MEMFAYPTMRVLLLSVSLHQLQLLPAASAFAFAGGPLKLAPGAGLAGEGRGWLPSSLSAASSAATGTEESEAERLLRRARELREQAESAERRIHEDLVQKKKGKDAQTDQLIDHLFFPPAAGGSGSSSSLVDRLRDKRPCMDTLVAILKRLDEREVIARGGDHVVEVETSEGKMEFRKVSKDPDEPELQRLEGRIDDLIDAAGVLDAEFRERKKAKGQTTVAHAEEEHWGGGKCAEVLSDTIAQIRRERSEMFQRRMEEFREAQRLKDDDDHKFKGYIDLGPLN